MNSGAFLSTLQQLPVEKSRRIRQIRDRQAQLQSIIGLKLLKLGFSELSLRKFHLKKLHFSDLKPAIRNTHLNPSVCSGYSFGHFSISHSHNCVCCVIGNNKSVGIDVEKVRPLASNLIKKYQLAQNNVSAITTWTQKEAIFKVFGEDKLPELKQIKIKHGSAVFKNRQYYINSFKLDDIYTMSIASLQPNTKIKIKRVYF